jgi:SAM-dependent methyltransferase
LEAETPQMIARHLCAYRFAGAYCSAKEVLDVGFGEGYGSHYLAQCAASVVGIDYDQDIIRFAQGKYRSANLEFRLGAPQDAGFGNKKFDVVCSFQVIEHINEPALFLNSIKRLMRDDGRLILSTPNRLDASPRSPVPLNKFHVKEYLWAEFDGLLRGHFKKIEMFGLKRGKRFNFYRRLKKIGVCNKLPDPLNPVKRFYDHIDCNDFLLVQGDLTSALDFIAVCHT